MTASTNVSPRRGLGGFATLVGGALMIVSVFLPWLGSTGANVTGWDAYTTLKDAGQNGFFEQHFFDTGFSPFFSGVVALIAGGLLAIVGLALIASVRGGVLSLGAMGRTVLVIIGLLVLIVGITNLISLYATGDPDVVTPEWGLYLLTAGAIIGPLGILVGIGRGRSS